MPEEGTGSAPGVVQMCEWLEVSKSGFYEWRSRPQSAAGKRRELLKIKIKALFEANNEEYGYRRVHAPEPADFERLEHWTKIRVPMLDRKLPVQPP